MTHFETFPTNDMKWITEIYELFNRFDALIGWDLNNFSKYCTSIINLNNSLTDTVEHKAKSYKNNKTKMHY